MHPLIAVEKIVDNSIACNYCNNTMKIIELKVTRIGNSRGIRIPADTLRRYNIAGGVLMEERTEGIFLHSKLPEVDKLSWDDTAREMAENREDWGEWDVAVSDGLEGISWESKIHGVAENRATYKSIPSRGRHKAEEKDVQNEKRSENSCSADIGG